MTRPKPYRPPTSITLAGVPSAASSWSGSPTGSRATLQATGCAARSKTTYRILGLEIEEREAILAALEDPPLGLSELRAVLLAEHVGRVRDGLS
jgi:hypothetical protein